MVNFTPDIDRSAHSPDRVDALVWGFTELFPQMTRRLPEPEPEYDFDFEQRDPMTGY